ncbi:thymidine kinase [Porifericola rhodea]|uniref:thymidine kinase n=1 Tax=Porifericola rhodea TaxID=930972 RepID=UPI002666D363|nr:thymidine kinase [Porifericola rhodea]WKN33464.1 thymidine kinase [Porifericola rhodea]
MFVEPQMGGLPYENIQAGWIEVICGCMFSGKTEELIRRLNRAIIAQQHVEIFKPSLDTRYHTEEVVSHNKTRIASTVVDRAEDILAKSGNCKVIGIDEAQFFDDKIVEVCNSLANQGKRVIIAGLDMDYEGLPFGPMPALVAIAEYVTKVHAICTVCGAPASFSYRLSQEKEKMMLGANEQYEARCRLHFNKGMQARLHGK